jgi:hypothetical protein
LTSEQDTPQRADNQANALVPATDALKINAQERDVLQHELQLQFRVASRSTPSSLLLPGVILSGVCLTLLAGFWYRQR